VSRPIAIVTDALWRKSVAAIRALGTSGYSVFALGDGRLTTGFYSRYTSRRFIGPVAAEDPDGFGETLERAIEATGGEPAALLPMEDATCRTAVSWRRTSGGCCRRRTRSRWLATRPARSHWPKSLGSRLRAPMRPLLSASSVTS